MDEKPFRTGDLPQKPTAIHFRQITSLLAIRACTHQSGLTYGNISDGDTVVEPVSDRVREDGVVVDRDVEDREVVAGTSPTKKY
jgi:hypothetical protein